MQLQINSQLTEQDKIERIEVMIRQCEQVQLGIKWFSGLCSLYNDMFRAKTELEADIPEIKEKRTGEYGINGDYFPGGAYWFKSWCERKKYLEEVRDELINKLNS